MTSLELFLLLSVILLFVIIVLLIGYIWLILPVRIRKIADNAINDNNAISNEEGDFGEEDEN